MGNSTPEGASQEAAEPEDGTTLAERGWVEEKADGFVGMAGPFWKKTEEGKFMLGFRAAEKHRNKRGVVHGGMLATLADRAMGTAAWLGTEQAHATIQLDLHYIDAARLGEFVEAHCSVRRRTKFVTFVEAEIFADGRVVATARGIWKALGTPRAARSGEAT